MAKYRKEQYASYEVLTVNPQDGKREHYTWCDTREEAVDVAVYLIRNGELNAPHIIQHTEIPY